MQCQYVLNNGKKCNQPNVKNLDRCHILSHQSNLVLYQENLMKLREEFMNETVSMDNFSIQKIPQDALCAYQCMIFALKNNKKYIIQSFETDFLDQLNESLDEGKDEELAYLLQQIIREWIMSHQDVMIQGMMLKDYICLCHNLDRIEQYNDLYKKYIVQQGEYARWAGAGELFAFTQIFGLKINLYLLQRFSKKLCKTIHGSVKDGSSRLKYLRSIGTGKAVYILLGCKRDKHFYYYMQY